MKEHRTLESLFTRLLLSLRCPPSPDRNGKQRLAYLEFRQNWKGKDLTSCCFVPRRARVYSEETAKSGGTHVKGWLGEKPREALLGRGAGRVLGSPRPEWGSLIPVTLVECPLSFLPTPHC